MVVQIFLWQLLLAVVAPDAVYIEDLSVDGALDTLLSLFASTLRVEDRSD
jgi:hypothetical protein